MVNLEQSEKQPTMAELLETIEPPRSLRRGEVVEGEVMWHDQTGILVSIGHKSEGLIPPHEMRCLTPAVMDRYQPGATILVYVVDPSGAEGEATLSLDKAREESGWKVLEDAQEAGDPIKGSITGYNRGGVVVDVEGVQGFVPLSQLANPRGVQGEDLTELKDRVGESVTLKVLEVNRRRNRAVLSERALVREKREAQKDELLAVLNEGEIRKGRVTSVSSFGAFADLGGADGLIHISEMSWLPVSSVEDIVKVGDEVEVYILHVDVESRRIALSLRRLQPAPWDEAANKYAAGQLVAGTVTRFTDFGAFAKVDESIEGLIHISELSDRHIQHPKEVVQIGDTLTLRIVSMDPARHRLGLSLKQVEEYEKVQLG